MNKRWRHYLTIYTYAHFINKIRKFVLKNEEVYVQNIISIFLDLS
jgi:hypothetical protein